MTIFFSSSPLSPYSKARRHLLREEGSEWNPFLPTKLETIGKRLRDARSETERARKSSSSRASERASGKTKIDAFKVFPYPPLSGRGGREKERGRRGKPLSAPVSLAPLFLYYPLNSETDRPMEVQENISKLFSHPLSPPARPPRAPPRNFKASPSFLPRLFYFPHLFSQLPPTFLEKTGEKQKSLP